MNAKSEESIRKVFDTKEQILKIAETGDKYAQHRLLMLLSKDTNTYARRANASEIFLSFKNRIQDALIEYNDGSITQSTALVRIADAFADACNDQRDGLVLVDDLFGIREDGIDIRKKDQEMQQAFGTTDWKELTHTMFNRVYSESEGLSIIENTNTPEDIPLSAPEEEKSLETLLTEMENLIGLSTVKNEVNSFINLLRICSERERRGIDAPDITMHLVFTGNPGTGKTTVARLLAKIYKQLGILTKGHLVEVERADLCGGYVGQTAIKTKEVIDKAMGGVLFIDEAYSLTNGKSDNDYGREAVETLLKSMEDHRHNLVVIVAGYTDLMSTFINSNPGLKSRFNKFIEFPDYNPDELNAIFQSICEKNGFHTDEISGYAVKQFCTRLYKTRDAHYANARDVRNFFEKVMSNQANRLMQGTVNHLSTDEMLLFTRDDVEKAAAEYGFSGLHSLL